MNNLNLTSNTYDFTIAQTTSNDRRVSRIEKEKVYFDSKSHTLWVRSDYGKYLSSQDHVKAVNLLASQLLINDHVKVNLHLTKVNASTVKGLLNIFNQLKHAAKNKVVSEVKWFIPWGDDEIFDLSHDFSELYDFHIELIPC